MLDAIAHSSDLFSDAIRNIPSKAGRILRDLNQSLWNGRMVAEARRRSPARRIFRRILLKEISDTGARTKDVFGGSIGDLHQTVVTSLAARQSIPGCARHRHHGSESLRARERLPMVGAGLHFLRAIVERAMLRPGRAGRSALFCARSTTFTRSTPISLCSIGTAKSSPSPMRESSDLAGSVLEEEWVGHILALRDAQDYVVSEFAPSPLYDGRPTYIYGAAIRSRQAPAGRRRRCHRVRRRAAICRDAQGRLAPRRRRQPSAWRLRCLRRAGRARDCLLR